LVKEEIFTRLLADALCWRHSVWGEINGSFYSRFKKFFKILKVKKYSFVNNKYDCSFDQSYFTIDQRIVVLWIQKSFLDA